MINKIISGGQVGADLAALRIAKHMGIRTGGTAPQGYKTLAGPNYDLRDRYGLYQATTDSYAARTFLNVQDSDGTLRIARNFETYGEQCTLKAIQKFEKPYFDVWLRTGPSYNDYCFKQSQLDGFLVWLDYYDIKILNVAGNAAPIIQPIVEDFLCQAIKREREA